MGKRFQWDAHKDGLLKTYAEAGRSSASAAALIGCDRKAAQYRAIVLGVPFKAEAGRAKPTAPPRRRRPLKRTPPVAFLDATASQCAWPLVKRGEPGHARMMVCGAAVVKRCSYCERHQRRAYRDTETQGYEAAFSGGLKEASL